jgi:hypothetical protein
MPIFISVDQKKPPAFLAVFGAPFIILFILSLQHNTSVGHYLQPRKRNNWMPSLSINSQAEVGVKSPMLMSSIDKNLMYKFMFVKNDAINVDPAMSVLLLQKIVELGEEIGEVNKYPKWKEPPKF